jgi:hypothetical protein
MRRFEKDLMDYSWDEITRMPMRDVVRKGTRNLPQQIVGTAIIETALLSPPPRLFAPLCYNVEPSYSGAILVCWSIREAFRSTAVCGAFGRLRLPDLRLGNRAGSGTLLHC